MNIYFFYSIFKIMIVIMIFIFYFLFNIGFLIIFMRNFFLSFNFTLLISKNLTLVYYLILIKIYYFYFLFHLSSTLFFISLICLCIIIFNPKSLFFTKFFIHEYIFIIAIAEINIIFIYHQLLF